MGRCVDRGEQRLHRLVRRTGARGHEHAAAQLARQRARLAAQPGRGRGVVLIGHSHTGDAGDTILIVGVGKLMTSLGRCCKPAPPDAIQGYVTRGRGVSIHRIECQDFQALVKQHPERLVSAEWGGGGSPKDAVFAVDILVHAMDRQGLLRDISEVLSREKLNVIAVNTLSRKGAARMRFTLEVHGVQQIQRALKLVRDVKGVTDVERG